MPFHATPEDPAPEPIAFGQRMQLLRTRRGMSREVLAGLLGKSTSWVKQIENGRLKTPKLETILAVAEALRVRDLNELTGEQSHPVEVFIGPGHPRLAAVAAAVNSLPLSTSRQAPPTAHLRARLDRAWEARHSAPNHRAVIGALLPDLIRDAQLAARQADRSAIPWRVAVLVGIAQVVAGVFPGTSRSAATIFVALLAGTSNRAAATEFAFLVGIPTMFAASGYELLKALRAPDGAPLDAGALALGFVASMLTAFVAVRWLLDYIRTHRFTPFAIYRIVLGIVLLVALPAGA